MSKTRVSPVRSFRLSEELGQRIESIREVENLTLQDIITGALREYVEKYFGQTEASLEILKKEVKSNQYMFIPMKHYMEFNGFNRIEMQKELNKGNIRSITIGDTTLIAIKTSEEVYTKAELSILKSDVVNLKKELHDLQNAVHLIKRKCTTA